MPGDMVIRELQPQMLYEDGQEQKSQREEQQEIL
jgi:hypothetical protein